MTTACKNCAQNFEVTAEHLAFYAKLQVPPPTHCPDCRLQRRLAWRNEKSLYKRKCDLCGKNILTFFPSNTPYTIYCQNCWWSNHWDPDKYGQEFDFSRPFFEQFRELMQKVPLLNLLNQATTLQNSDYVNYVTDAKNCYLVFAANFLEDCLYSSYIWEAKDVSDCMNSTKLELCYYCLDCDNLFNCQFLQNCKNCHDCILGYELSNCKNCFGCVNLRNKEFHFFNKPLSKEEYTKKVEEILNNPKEFAEAQKEFKQFSLKFPKRSSLQINCENSTGDSIKNCKNCLNCFDGYGGQDLEYVINFPGNTKDCYDISGCADIELSYESLCVGLPGYEIKFCNGAVNGGNAIFYCLFTDNSHNCFGCISTKKGQYYILNKKYSKEEYFKLKEKIIEHMKKTGEYGEFFPIRISPFCYNETVAHEHFPLTKEQALAKSYRWKDDKNEDNPQVSKANSKDILLCESCHKIFRIIPAEIKFYERLKLQIPKKCYFCRSQELRNQRPPRKIWHRNCQKCQSPISTSYSPSRPETVYCEKCFLESLN